MNEVNFPVDTIRTALRLNKKDTQNDNKEALLNESGDSGDEEDSGRGKLLKHSASEESGGRVYEEDGTDSDVSQGVFSNEQESVSEDMSFQDIAVRNNGVFKAPRLPAIPNVIRIDNQAEYIKLSNTPKKEIFPLKRPEKKSPPLSNKEKKRVSFDDAKQGQEKGEEKENSVQVKVLTNSSTKSMQLNGGAVKQDKYDLSRQVVLYQSVADGTIAIKTEEDDDFGTCKDSYTDNEIIAGVSFKMKYLGSTPIASVKHQVEDIRAHQAQAAINTICEPSESRPSNPVIFTVSAAKLLIYDGKMQQILMDHSIKYVSYIGDVGKFLVVMVRSPTPKEATKATYRVTCHVFESPHSKQVSIAVKGAFNICYKDVIQTTGKDEETLLQCAYSEVLGSQKRADEDIADLLDSTKHKVIPIIKRPQEALGISLIPSGPGSIIPTVIISSLRPSSPAYKTNQLNVGDQILEVNGRSLCGLIYDEIMELLKSLLSDTKIELKVVPGSPVLLVELIRPDLKYPLGFSVKDGHITTLIRGSIGERGGVRIGHRIIDINGQSMVTSDHDTIAGILLSETGRLTLKTMPSQIFNLMLAYDTPLYL